jgi:hypothetical protein
MSMEEQQLEELPNSRRVRNLGLMAMIAVPMTIVLYVFGLALIIGTAVWAIVLYRKDIAIYRLAPQEYDPKSYSRLTLGYFWAVLGLVLCGLFIVIISVNYGKDGLN